MITIKDFMETINYRITEGSEYLWDSFGPDAYRLDSWTGYLDDDGKEYTISIIFDTVTQLVYQFEAHDYFNERSYRWTHPDYKDAYMQEQSKKLKKDSQNIAYDNVKFVDLELKEDMLNKARAIVSGKDYDTRVSIPIDLEDHELFYLMKQAHEKDITFNKLVEEILTQVINKESSKA